MNGVDLPTVGRLLGQRRLETTAIYAHLDDAALQGAAEKAAGRIAKAMGFKAETLSGESDNAQRLQDPPNLRLNAPLGYTSLDADGCRDPDLHSPG